MKWNYRIVYGFLMGMLLAACATQETYKDCEHFTFEDFPQEITLRSEPVEFDEPVMLPRVLAIKDSILLVQNSQTENFLHIYDLAHGKKLKECLPFGMGPEEFLRVKHIQVVDSLLYVFDNDKGTMTAYKIRDIVMQDTARCVSRVRIEDPMQQALRCGDKYVALTLHPDRKRLTFYDEEGNLLDSTGEFPEINRELTPVERMVSFLAEMACTDDRLFVSYMQTDLLELYDVEGSLLKRMQGPDGFFPHIREVSDGRYSKTTSVKGESRDAYFTPVAVNGKFYVSYTGAVRLPTRVSPVRDILVFDKDGNPLTRYRLPEPIIRFTVSPETGVIYAISDQPEYHIIKLVE